MSDVKNKIMDFLKTNAYKDYGKPKRVKNMYEIFSNLGNKAIKTEIIRPFPNKKKIITNQ